MKSSCVSIWLFTSVTNLLLTCCIDVLQELSTDLQLFILHTHLIQQLHLSTDLQLFILHTFNSATSPINRPAAVHLTYTFNSATSPINRPAAVHLTYTFNSATSPINRPAAVHLTYGSFSEVGFKYVTSNLKNKVQRRKLKSGYLINMIVLLLNLEKDSKEMLLFSYQGLSKYVTTQPRAVEAWTPTFVKNGCYTWITRKRNKSYSL